MKYLNRIVFATFVFIVSSSGQHVGWLPVTDAERSLKAPLLDKDAGVEALFWRVHITDELAGGQDLQRVLHHYVRLKVFDEKGKTKAATVDIEFGQNTGIVNISGRTIKADGTEIELKKDNIFERDLVRIGRRRYKVKSLAFPGVEPGAIIEYRWKEIRNDTQLLYLPIQFQREYPVHKVTYFVKPLPVEYLGSLRMVVWPFNCKPSPLKQENDNYQSVTLENVPAFHEEPMMPGHPAVRAWMLILYSEDGKRDPEKYWDKTGKEVYSRSLKPAMKPTREVEEAATAAVTGATTDEQKAAALVAYVRKNLRDLFGSAVTDAERTKVLKQMPKDRLRTAGEILKSGIGTADELNTLFAAMATRAGLDARPALVADRSGILFHPSIPDKYFLPTIDMAIQIDGKWRLYDVSARRLPASMISWREQGMAALITDSKKPVFIESVPSPPELSKTTRSAKFELSEEGSLEGDIDEEYTGHAAAERRTDPGKEAETRLTDQFKEQISKSFPDSEVSAIKFENMDDPEKPLKMHYHLRVNGYATRTGKRILLQPFFFQRGDPPVFSAAERKYDIFFPYAWDEKDTVVISLPDGFSLDNADNPGPIDFGSPGSYSLEMAIRTTGAKRELVCKRSMIFGKEKLIGFRADVYPKLKAIFDEVHRRDNHAISLRQDASAGGSK